LLAPAIWCTMRVIAYNPQTVKEQARLEEISATFKHADFVVLIGTNEKARTDEKVHHSSTERHKWWHWGWNWSRASGPATGIAFGLRGRTFQEKDVYKVYEGDEELKGRVAGLRIRNASCDYTCLAAYYPTKQDGRKAKAYKNTTEKINNWLEKKIEQTPSRSTLLICCDLNDTLKEKHEAMEEEKAKGWSQPTQKMGKKTEKKREEETIELSGKMCLQLTQRGREHEAGNFDTIRIKGQRKAATMADVYATRKVEDKKETQKHLQPLRLNKCYDQKRTRRKRGIMDEGARQKAKAKHGRSWADTISTKGTERADGAVVAEHARPHRQLR